MPWNILNEDGDEEEYEDTVGLKLLILALTHLVCDRFLIEYQLPDLIYLGFFLYLAL